MRKTKTKQWLAALFAAGSLWVSAQTSCTLTTCTGTVPVCERICNGGFLIRNSEPDRLTLSGGFQQVERCCGWGSVWTTFSTPDYYTAAAQYTSNVQIPCNGNGNQSANLDDCYVGLMASTNGMGSQGDWKEAIRTTFSSSLAVGETVEVSFYLSLADAYQYNTLNSFGVEIMTGNSPMGPTYVNTSAVTSTGWTKFSFQYTSGSGGEDGLRIGFLRIPDTWDYVTGNSSPSSCTGVTPQGLSYYYLDNVSVRRVDNLVTVASNTTGCTGDSYTLTASGATSYTWNPGGLTGASVVVTPTATTIYTLTATNASLCVMTPTTIGIYPAACCTNTNSNNITLKNVTIVASGGSRTWASMTPGNTYTGTVTAPPSGVITNTLTIHGGLTINAPVQFTYCNVALSDGVNINQNSNVTIGKSWFFGCQNMWGGIQSKAQLNIYDSYIEDAYWGVNAGFFLFITTHPGLFVDNVVFNKNYMSIMAGSCNMSPSNWQVTGCVFTCRRITAAQHVFNVRYNTYYNLPGIPTTTLLPTTVNGITANTKRSNIGVYLNNLITTNGNLFPVGDVNSDPTANANLVNKFDNLNVGVYNQNTKTRIYNNRFSWMNTNSLGTALGAIYHNDHTLNANNTITQVGNMGGSVPNAHYKNVFGFSTQSTLVDGVTAENGGTLNVINNDFNTISRYGVNVKTWGAANVNLEPVMVSNNSYSTTAYAFYGYNNNGVFATITSNTLVQTATTYSNYSNVYIDEINKNANSTYSITSNNFSGSLNGIFAQNAQNVKMDNNIIQIKKPTSTSVYNGAIWLSNTQSCYAGNNKLSCSPTNANSWNTFGVFANASQTLSVKCNSISAVSACLKFQQDCRPTTILTNTLNNNVADPCLYGLWLDNLGETGSIGYYTGSQWQYSDNVWGDFLGSGADSYAQNTSNQALGKIYYDPAKSTSLYYPTVNGLIGGGVAFVPTSTNVANSQGCGGEQRLAQTSGGKNTNSGDLNSTLTSNPKTLFLPMSNTNSEAKVIKGANESNFYAIDSLIEVYKATDNISALNQAKAINNSITPNNNQENHLKNFNGIYCVFLQGDSLVSSNQINDLQNMASLCPFTEGLAVYEARGLVRHWDDSTFYYNVCENNIPAFAGDNSRFALGNNENITNNTVINVYPNPSQGDLSVTSNLKDCIFEVYDITGRNVLTQKLNENETKVNVSSLNNGTYLYKISKNGKTVKADKLILNK